LASEGYVVSEAPDAIRGLERLRDVSPDLIILDLNSAAPRLDALGVRADLSKPFDVDSLLALVAQLV
jgi:DNA-binding response OmpR family regulator